MGTKAYDASREPAQIVVDQPIVKDGAAETESRTVTLNWSYKEPQILGRPKLDENHEAAVTVRRLNDNVVLLDGEKQRGSATIDHLMDGSYAIKVAAADSYQTIVLTVKPKPALPAASVENARRNKK